MNIEDVKFDVDKIIKEKLPGRKVPRFIVRYLRKIVHEAELNMFMELHGQKKDFEFIEGIFDFFKITTSVTGVENLPHGGRYIIASNHPLGGMDGVSVAYYLGKQYNGKVRVYANDILMFVKPLNDLFIPINKTGAQGKHSVSMTQEFFDSDNHLITFPAGQCSRKFHGEIKDPDWKKNFISKSIQYQRDVIPVFFEGRNSNFFYNLARLRKFLGFKVNIEMLYLVDEFFKQTGKHHTIRIGKPIPWQTFDKSKSHAEWALWVEDEVYQIK